MHTIFLINLQVSFLLASLLCKFTYHSTILIANDEEKSVKKLTLCQSPRHRLGSHRCTGGGELENKTLTVRTLLTVLRAMRVSAPVYYPVDQFTLGPPLPSRIANRMSRDAAARTRERSHPRIDLGRSDRGEIIRDARVRTRTGRAPEGSPLSG